MIFKLIQSIKEKLISNEDNQALETEQGDLLQDGRLENPIAEFVIQISSDGDFVIGAECEPSSETDPMIIGATLHMMNSGLLAEYFIEALTLWIDDDNDKRLLVFEIINNWKEFFETEAALEQQSATTLAVNPKDVFNLSDMK